jgi:hypothetical protein
MKKKILRIILGGMIVLSCNGAFSTTYRSATPSQRDIPVPPPVCPTDPYCPPDQLHMPR